MYVDAKTITYFDSLGVEHIPKEIKKFINNQNIIVNTFRIQAYDSVMCGYFCIELINFMFKVNSLTDFTNLFSPNNFKKDDEILKMAEYNSVETPNTYPNLNDQQQFRLNKINEIKYFFCCRG